MARSARSGMPRSRRRPDPSSRWRPGQTVYPINPVVVTVGVGSFSALLDFADPTTGGSYGGPDLMATGVPTTTRLIRDNGDIYVPDVIVNTTNSQVTYEITSGLPAGIYALVSNGLDPAVRNAASEWTGTVWASGTVT